MPKISEGHIEALVAWAEESLPNEACGLITRDRHGQLGVSRMNNVHPDPTRNFSFDATSLVKTFEAMVEREWTYIGTWHSHPTQEAKPSLNDIRGCTPNNPSLHIILGRLHSFSQTWRVNVWSGDFSKWLGGEERRPKLPGLVYADPSKSVRT